MFLNYGSSAINESSKKKKDSNFHGIKGKDFSPIINCTNEFQRSKNIPSPNISIPIKLEVPTINQNIITKREQAEEELGKFLKQAKQAKESLERLKQINHQIENLHRQILLAVSLEEAKSLSSQVDAQVAEHQTTATQLRNLMKILGEKAATTTDRRIQATRVHSLSKDFLEQMSAFRDMQTRYQLKYKNQLERQYLIVRPQASRVELDRLGDVENPLVLSQQMFRFGDMAAAQETLKSMQERQYEIRKIEQSVSELHQLFLEIGTIVEQQATHISSLAQHVAATEAYTEQTVLQTEQAAIKKRKLRKVTTNSN